MRSPQQRNAAPAQPATRASRRVSAAILVRFTLVVAVCTVADLVIPSPPGLAISAAVALAWYAWLAKYEAKSALLGLNPVVYTQVIQAAMLGVAPLYIALANYDDPFVNLVGNWLSLDTVAYGHALMVVGSLPFYAGLKQFQPREVAQSDAPVSGPSVAVLAVAGIVGVAFHLARETVTSYVGSAVSQLDFLPLAVLSMIALRPPAVLRRSEKTQVGILLLGGMILLALNARRDSKEEMMLSFLPLAWWALTRRKWFLLFSQFLLFGLLFVLVIAPVTMAVRDSTDSARDRSVRRVLNPDTFNTILPTLHGDFLSDAGTFALSWIGYTMDRLCIEMDAGWLASLADRTGFLYGSELAYVPIAVIPRAIWHNKPIIIQGLYITYLLGGAQSPDTAESATAVTSAGELYWNFGWPGVVIGMYVLGAALSGLWWRAAGSDPRRGLLHMAAYMASMLIVWVSIGSGAGEALSNAITAGVFWRVVLAIRERFDRRKPVRLAPVSPRILIRYGSDALRTPSQADHAGI